MGLGYGCGGRGLKVRGVAGEAPDNAKMPETLYGKPVRVVNPGPFVVGPFGTPWPPAPQPQAPNTGGTNPSSTMDDLMKALGFKPTDSPDISEADTLEIRLPVCTANPSCGEDDVICPQCKAGNCPGVKCWRGCNG